MVGDGEWGGGKSESLVVSMLSSMKNVLYSHSYIIHYISLPSHMKCFQSGRNFPVFS